MWKMVGIFNVSNSDLKIMIKEFGDLQRQKENLPSFPLRRCWQLSNSQSHTRLWPVIDCVGELQSLLSRR